MLRALKNDVREMVLEQIEYRDLLLTLTRRDLLLRYKQTVMGFSWAIFMPVMNTVIFSVIFMRVAPLNTDVPYPVYAFAGLLPWNFFSNSLKFSVASLVGNTSLVTKVYFPRELFPFSSILVCLVDFAVASTVLVGLMIFYGIGITWAALFLPVIILTQTVFTAGIALLLAMWNLLFRDVKYLFEMVLTIWMFATSVVYPVTEVGGTLGTILMLNPMTPIIDGYRAVLLRGELPQFQSFAYAAAFSVAMAAIGWISFHRAEYQFAEKI